MTECPYCGARLRKRAPKLERTGEGIEPKQGRRRRRVRLGRSRSDALAGGRPWATIALILVPAILLVVGRAGVNDIGYLIVPFEIEWWRYLTAPFAYDDTGYLFVVAVALALFAPGLERRIGSVTTAILLVACGALGALAAEGIETGGDQLAVIAGGNGIALGCLAAWSALRRAEARAAIDEDTDWIGVSVAAAVLLMLPLLEDTASIWAGLTGAVVGGVAGFAGAALRPAE